MSWKVSKLVREARLAGLYKDVQPTEFFVLRELADACRNDSVVASISMSELQTLTGLSRTTMSRAVRALIAKECIRRTEYGSQGQSSKYALLQPESRSANATYSRGANATYSRGADATYSRGADATWWEDDHVAYHVANATDHVANAADHVAPTQRPRSAHATNPETEITIPSTYPETTPRVRARARARESAAMPLLEKHVPGRHRRAGAKPVLLHAVGEALRQGLDENEVADALIAWQAGRWPHSSYALRSMLDEALKAAGLKGLS